MRKRRFKQVFAAFMAFVLMMSMSTAAFAAEPEPRNDTTIYKTEVSDNGGNPVSLNGPRDVSADLVSKGISGQEISKGTLEGEINDEVFHVSVPTSGNQALRFILDPQKLIKRSNGSAYPSANFLFPEGMDHTMFFRSSSQNAGTSKNKWAMSPSSDTIRMINYSSVSVDVAVTATLATAASGKISVSHDNADFTDDKTADIWMKVVSFNVAGNSRNDETGVVTPVTKLDPVSAGPDKYVTTDGLNIEQIIKHAASANESKLGAMDGMYTVSMEAAEPEKNWINGQPTGWGTTRTDSTNPDVAVYSEHKYNYKLGKDYMPSANDLNPKNAFNEYRFYLTGSANTAADWKGLSSNDVPTISLVWNIKPISRFGETGPKIEMTAAGVITMSNLTSEQNWRSLKVSFTNGTAQEYVLDSLNTVTWNNDDWSNSSGGTLICTLGDAWNTFVEDIPVTATMTLTDDTTKSVTTTINRS